MRYYLLSIFLLPLLNAFGATVDAAFSMYENYVMLVQGDKLIQFDMRSNTVVKTSYLSQNGLPGVNYTKIDAALNYGNGKVYFFSGTTYTKFDLTTFKAESGYPKTTAEYWPGVNLTSIDAATQWSTKSYFFSGSQYLRFNNETNTTDAGYPKIISTTTWGNLPFTKLDAAFSFGGKSYFFSGDQYAQYDIQLDKMDAGYPKKIADWLGLNQALGSATTTTNTISTNTNSKPINWNETMLTLSMGNQITYDNRADLEFNSANLPVIIYSFERDGSYIQPLTKYYTAASNPIYLKGLYFYDFLIINDTYYVLAKEHAGYKGEGCLDYEDEGNILIFLKIKTDGTIVYKKNLFGHEGTTGGSKFLCTMSSAGELAFDGTYFHAFVETCGNFSAKGSTAFDVHEGDYYLTFDMNGDVRENGRSIWNHSHSNLLQLTTDETGEAYTLEVSDGGPWGINFDHFSNGKRIHSTTLYPDAAKLPYEDMYAVATNTTDAGEIGGMVQFGDLFFTVIATVPSEKHPIAEQPKDLLFISFDKSGNKVTEKWIRRTADVDESVPFIRKYGDYILMVYMVKTGTWQHDYKATVGLLNVSGEYVSEPVLTKYILNWQSRLFDFPNGDIGLISADAQGHDIEIVRFGTERLPSRLDPADEKHMGTASAFSNATVKPLMPELGKEQGVVIDLRKPADQNLRFNGTYNKEYPFDATNGIYCDGIYRNDNTQFYVYIYDFDLTNFAIEVEFKVSEFQDAPVFSLSSGYRTAEYFLTPEGKIKLHLNNSDIKLTTEATYKTDFWHTAKIEAIGETITIYLDGKSILNTTAKLIDASGETAMDIVTTSYSNGKTFKGHIRSFQSNTAN
jgi:hypothetical protein